MAVSPSSSQPTLFITFWKVLQNNSWRSNKYSKENKQTEHGGGNVQMNEHAYVRRWLDQTIEGIWCG